VLSVETRDRNIVFGRLWFRTPKIDRAPDEVFPETDPEDRHPSIDVFWRIEGGGGGMGGMGGRVGERMDMRKHVGENRLTGEGHRIGGQETDTGKGRMNEIGWKIKRSKRLY